MDCRASSPAKLALHFVLEEIQLRVCRCYRGSREIIMTKGTGATKETPMRKEILMTKETPMTSNFGPSFQGYDLVVKMRMPWG